MVLMHIDIWSDVVCPWCYLGKRRLERALDEFEHRGEVSIAHRSFQLDPSRPKHATMSRRQMLMAKYHLTEDQVAEMDGKMERTAARDGLIYRLSPEGVTGNTLDAHRLLHFAKARGREEAMLDRLYRAYFSEQRSVFDTDSLMALAKDAGLDGSEAREVLNGDAYSEDVDADIKEARLLGVSGVPFFVIDDRYGVSGAQPVDVFRQVLSHAWANRVTAS
jgi:predicted DsbA family dithiol-disulfide isomerase